MSSKWMMFAAALGLLAGVGLADAQTTQGATSGGGPSPASATAKPEATAPGSAPKSAAAGAPQGSAPAAGVSTEVSTDPTGGESKGRVPKQKISAPTKQKPININAATKDELKKLPGGSDEEADKIIAGRPYKSKSFLVENKIIPMGRYIEIRKMIVAGDSPKKSAPAKK